MPAPSGDFFELEAAKAWQMSLDRWYALPIDLRARMLAHEIERNLREGYLNEATLEGKKDKPQNNARTAMWAQFGMTP